MVSPGGPAGSSGGSGPSGAPHATGLGRAPGGRPGAEHGPWRFVQAALATLVAGFFLYALRDILNPFVLYWVLLGLLVPFRGLRGHTWIVVLATALTLLWTLATAGALLAPFILAFVLAYALDPVVDRIAAFRRISRSVAILLLAVPVVVAGTAVLVVGVPALVRQALAMAAEVPRVLAALDTAALARIDLPLLDEEALLARLRAVDGQAVAEFLQTRLAGIAQGVQGAVLGLGRGIASLITVAGYLVLTPVLAFYLLRDYDGIVARAGALLPHRVRAPATEFFVEYDGLLSRYLRGQVLVALIVGGITWLGLFIAGIPYSLFLGALVAVLGIVPYLGVVLSLIPAVVIALAMPEPGVALIKIGVVYAVAQGLEGAVVSPRIVGDSVGLHPVWILLALSLGGFVFGFAGLLIGVPLAVGVKLALARGLKRYRASALFQEPSQ